MIDELGRILFKETIYLERTIRNRQFLFDVSEDIHKRTPLGRTLRQVYSHCKPGYITEMAMCQALGVPYHYKIGIDPYDQNTWAYDCEYKGHKLDAKNQSNRNTQFNLPTLQYEKLVKLAQLGFLVIGHAGSLRRGDDAAWPVDFHAIIAMESYRSDSRKARRPANHVIYDYHGDPWSENYKRYLPDNCQLNPRFHPMWENKTVKALTLKKKDLLTRAA